MLKKVVNTLSPPLSLYLSLSWSDTPWQQNYAYNNQGYGGYGGYDQAYYDQQTEFSPSGGYGGNYQGHFGNYGQQGNQGQGGYTSYYQQGGIIINQPNGIFCALEIHWRWIDRFFLAGYGGY